jgi:large subunit ribosomal protein L6
MVIGVSAGFSKKLEIVGVGYKVDLKGKNLVFQLGYSHLIDFPLPSGIDAVVEDRGTTVTVSGIDKEVVGQTAAVIRGFRPPDSYKGKGVRYSGEYIRIKAGKAAKA